MKKFLSIVIAIILCVGLISCRVVKNNVKDEKVDLIVFAAASMTETLSEIKTMYEKEHRDVSIIYNFDSSGTLLKQILAGAECDVFISAAVKQMNSLDITCDESANKDRNDFVLSDTRINLLENKVALAVPDGNPKGIKSFDDILTDKLSLLAIGNADVPVGAYTLEILESLGKPVAEFEKEGKVTYGSNVKEVTTQVKEGLVDAGIIYATDAFSAGLYTVDLADASMCRQVIYPAAVLKTSKNRDVAKEYLDYLRSDVAMSVFEKVGFTRAE
ncbi:MAG: molybdate ABC transporter substrate-binding protein [Lachnospiraceae bacterium]|nr:molybdate ABC transporter substrate-binding protein [Lachnospiraceae bacterium]